MDVDWNLKMVIQLDLGENGLVFYMRSSKTCGANIFSRNQKLISTEKTKQEDLDLCLTSKIIEMIV